MSALLDRDEKSVARGVGIDGFVQEHALQALQQRPNRTELMRRSGQEFVRDGDEYGRPALLREAVGHRGDRILARGTG